MHKVSSSLFENLLKNVPGEVWILVKPVNLALALTILASYGCITAIGSQRATDTLPFGLREESIPNKAEGLISSTSTFLISHESKFSGLSKPYFAHFRW